jgi:hypothetical protein
VDEINAHHDAKVMGLRPGVDPARLQELADEIDHLFSVIYMKH